MSISQQPEPGSEILLHCGDTITITIEHNSLSEKAYFRTNLNHTKHTYREVIDHAENNKEITSANWYDLPMDYNPQTNSSEITIPLEEPGYYEGKAYLLQDDEDILWPNGDNIFIKVEPAQTICSNMMYSVFLRQFGSNKYQNHTHKQSDHQSGTFSGFSEKIDFIVNTLGFSIIQFLPVHPVPAEYAKMGDYGSPFASLDFMDVEHSYADFDGKTTPLEQFESLIMTIHNYGAQVFLDMPINHTGWASKLQTSHPQWFCKTSDGNFKSPGAWGVIWADLVELDYSHKELWTYMANVFLFWCKRGVDGFRCDAGYMIPAHVWQYITAKVRSHYPDTIFMLEGLGGKISVTNQLLTESNLNWAYSELFQNYNRLEIYNYINQAQQQSITKGPLIHFAETHDNNRLAATSQKYARFRILFCALLSHNGAFGITNGVEWFAQEKIDVHQNNALNWGASINMVDTIAHVNSILSSHKVFLGNCTLTFIDYNTSNSAAIIRTSPHTKNRLIIIVNFDELQENTVTWNRNTFPIESNPTDILSGHHVTITENSSTFSINLPPTSILALYEKGNTPDIYESTFLIDNQRRKQKIYQLTGIAPLDSKQQEIFFREPFEYLKSLGISNAPLPIIRWHYPSDFNRAVMIPYTYNLLIEIPYRFTVSVYCNETHYMFNKSLPKKNNTYFVIIPFNKEEFSNPIHGYLELTIYKDNHQTEKRTAPLYFLPSDGPISTQQVTTPHDSHFDTTYGILTTSMGTLTQAYAPWAKITSKYDALLAANLHSDCPADRHILFSRCRMWVIYREYSQEIHRKCQISFQKKDNTLQWYFHVPCGSGYSIPIRISVKLFENNSIIISTHRDYKKELNELTDHEVITLIIRPDIDDRSFHETTKAFTGAEHHWPSSVNYSDNGFIFSPHNDHALQIFTQTGTYSHEPEWHYMEGTSFDAERGMDSTIDMFSPGYFSFTLLGDDSAELEASVHSETFHPTLFKQTVKHHTSEYTPSSDFEKIALESMFDFIVKRDKHKSVIAGYPWFLDWGRDTLICLRGMISAGFHDEAEDILLQFASFERNGTIPNMIRGTNDSNRDTSDAPLWLFIATEDYVKHVSPEILTKECNGRTVTEILLSIATHYMEGTHNNIKMDPATSLIFSPSHYTWMDTNYPAGTPRVGYPIEIQALWYGALSFLATITGDSQWKKRALTVQKSVNQYYIVSKGTSRYLSDCIHTHDYTPVAKGTADDAIRPNQLFAITLGLINDLHLSKEILQTCETLLIPGAIRSLADRPVTIPLPVYNNGIQLNDPYNPFWGDYSGDEDNRRKPAYHNGTAWSWPFPSYSEALYQVYGDTARQTAKGYLRSCEYHLHQGCINHTPEVSDGNYPHTPKGCGAQAWGITELFRVWKLLTT